MRDHYEQLEELMSAEELRFFAHNLADFTITDRYLLDQFGAPQAQWLWIVRSDSTALIRLGVHRLQSDWGRAQLAVPGHRRCYHLSADGVQPVSDAGAHELLEALHYRLVDGVLYRGSEAVACVAIEASRSAHPAVGLRYRSLVAAYDRDHLTAMYFFARHELWAAYPSYRRLDSIRLDGEELLHLIQAMPAEQLAPLAARPQVQQHVAHAATN